MKLLLRAVVPASRAERGDDLVAVRAGEVAALASPTEASPPVDAASLRMHHDIASRIHDGGPSLPSRFGQTFADEAALAGALRERGTALAEALVSVGDQVEMSVTLTWRDPEGVGERDEKDGTRATARSGREFMESRVARERERRRAEDAVARLIDLLATERAFTRNRICPRDGVAAIVAVLIERDRVREFRERVSEFARADPMVSAAMHGPLPPYSFTS